MKKVFNFVLPVLSLLLLAAHFSRANFVVLPWIFLLMPLLFLVRREFIRVFLQIILFLGGFVWISAIYHYLRMRIPAGEPWLRLFIILGLISIFTFYTSCLMGSKRIKTWFGKK